MSDTQESIEKELKEKQQGYGELCARLGDAAYRLNRFQVIAQEIQAQIIKLDEEATKLQEKLISLKTDKKEEPAEVK
jgi:septation ring formation regulator EzrA